MFDKEVSYDFEFIKQLFKYATIYAQFKELHGLAFKGDTLSMYITSKGRHVLDNKWDYSYR